MHGRKRNAYKVLIGKSKGKTPFGRLMHRSILKVFYGHTR
jgi:hypothetical protein